MAEKVDLSLDDIIKMNRKSSTNQRSGNNNRSGNKPTQRLKNLGARSGIIRKGGPKQVVVRKQQQQQQQQSPKREPTMLHVSNLHYNVSNDDVRELFSEIGPIKKAAVHYDKSGRSLGTAEVTFTTRDAAIRAIKKYHQLPLDGRPMSITLVPTQTTIRSPTKSRIGVKPGSGIYKRPQNNNNNKPTRPGGQVNRGGRVVGNRKPQRELNKPQRGIKREPKKEVTAEQLDADLEAYTMNVD